VVTEEQRNAVNGFLKSNTGVDKVSYFVLPKR
jgi:hypothetical protein